MSKYIYINRVLSKYKISIIISKEIKNNLTMEMLLSRF